MVDWKPDHPNPTKYEELVSYRISGYDDEKSPGQELCQQPASGLRLVSHEEWSKLRYGFRDLPNFDLDGGVPRPASSMESDEIESGARSADADVDGTVNADDNCNLIANADQADSTLTAPATPACR